MAKIVRIAVFALAFMLIFTTFGAISGDNKGGVSLAAVPAEAPAGVSVRTGAGVVKREPVEGKGEGQTWSGAPGADSKNSTTQPASDPNGVTWRGPSAPGSKNYSGGSAPDVSTIGGGSGYVTCSSVQDGGWTTTSASFEPIVSCVFEAPEDGFVFIKATSSIGVATGGNYEARFNVNIDSTSGNASTDRWINAYTDATDGTDKNVALSGMFAVSAGSHTVYFLGVRYNGAGTVQLYDPSVSVIYFPSTTASILACGVSGNTVWNTSETSFQEIRSCSLNVPQAGYVFISADASAGLASGGSPYEARFRVGVDTVSGTASSDRWVNVYTDGGDGTDEAVGVSLLTSVTGGAHTFYFSGTRYNGTGPVQLYDPSLSVLYFPAVTGTDFKVCGAGGSDTWTNGTTSYSTIRSCSLSAESNGVVFVDASASAGLNDTAAGNDWEGQFRVGIDNDTGTSLADRWVNVYTDTTDGTDRPVADSVLLNLNAGVHTYYFVGRRYAGNGTLRLYSPSLTVLQFAPPAATETPTPEPTATETATAEPTATGEPSATPTVCAISFTDVPTDHTFYPFITCLACREILGGYTTGCETGDPCFRPGNLVSRAQLAKIVSNAAGFADPAGDQQFEDVLPGSTFFDFVWRLSDRGIVSGYPCGGPGEPCGDPALPYFRPNNNVTRGQISKVVSEAAGLSQTPTGQQFEDVAEGSTFYTWIWRLVDAGVMTGYACGGPGEPCGDPALPYFRPGNNATRGQASKIVSNTFFPECSPDR